MPETTRLAETIDAWWPLILAFLPTGLTNAGTEGINRLVTDRARTAFGFRNLDNQRHRVRFHCAPGNYAGQPAPRRPSPLNFDEPD